MSFDHPLMKKAPALAALKEIQEPKPEHVRACLLELFRMVAKQEDAIQSLIARAVPPLKTRDELIAAVEQATKLPGDE